MSSEFGVEKEERCQEMEGEKFDFEKLIVYQKGLGLYRFCLSNHRSSFPKRNIWFNRPISQSRRLQYLSILPRGVEEPKLNLNIS